MIRAFVSRAAVTAQVLSALLVLTVSIRFAYAGFRAALDSTRGLVRDAPPPHSSASKPRRNARPAAASASAAPGASAEPAATNAGAPLRVTLAVTSGPPRSEVYVNGRRVGHSPFLGDVSCKQGQPLRVEIVPEKGPLQRHVRVCTGTTIRISRP